MHFGVHFPLENVQLCKNAVFFALQKTKMRTFCFAEHFPLENVRKNAFLHQMHFCTNKMLQMHLMQKCI